MKRSVGMHLRDWAGRREVAAGLVLFAIGIAVGIAAFELRIGTPARMGPGFLPLGLGILLGVVGGAILSGGLRASGPVPSFRNIRPLISLIAGFAAFATLIGPAGLMIAAVAAVFISSLATRQHHWGEMLLYAMALASLSALLFVVLLEVPIKLWPTP